MGSKLTHTVKGPIASFRSADRMPIESLKIHFLPKQEGSGDPSPQNIRNIVGWTGCNLFKAKKNLISKYYSESEEKNGLVITPTENGISIVGTATARTACFIASKDHIPFKTGDKVTFSLYLNGDISECENPFIGYYKELGVFGASIGSLSTDNNYKKIWNVEALYNSSLTSHIDSYIYIPNGVTVDFEIGLQAEIHNGATAFEGIVKEMIPLSWSDHGVEYGGYIDPIRGKIVSEYRLYDIGQCNWHKSNAGSCFYASIPSYPYKSGLVMYCSHYKFDDNGYGSKGYYGVDGTFRYYYSPDYPYAIDREIYIHDDQYDSASDFKSATNGVMIAYPLLTPIEYDIDPISLQTFLDYNNFWSDMNDDTEVEYEFADHLSKRKALFQPETKIVNWNQISLDGNFQDADYRIWQWNVDYGAFQIHDGVATWTANKTPGAYYYTGFTRKVNYLLIPYNHKILVSAKMRTSAYYSTLQFRIYGMVNSTGGAHTYFYSDNVQAANTWQTVRGFISDRPETPPSNFDDVIIKRFKPLLCKSNHGSYEGIVDDGTTMDVKELMAFDLTQMFGLGNEPSTVEEFERICQINGIDLDAYQPYDTGTNKLFIMPM